MEKRKYNTKRRDTVLMIKGVSRRKRDAFKRKYRTILKQNGMHLTEFYIKVLEESFEHPQTFLHKKKGLRSIFS